MARMNPTDLVVTDSTDKPNDDAPARHTTAKPLPIDWREHVWPPKGPYGDLYWSTLFRHSIDRFHRLVTKHNLTHVKVGHVVFVESSYLWEQLLTQKIDLDAPDLDEPPPPRKPKRKKPAHDQTPRQP